ncbi:MAG: CBS domain-containing protein [Nitrosotalea sp.]
MKIDELLVGNYMSEYPISVKPEISFKTIVSFMAESRFSTLIVMEEEKVMPVGVFTERGIIKHVVSGKTMDQSIKQELIQPFVSVTPDTTIITAAKFMISKKSRILVFADTNKLIGTITASDMLRAFGDTDKTPSLEKVISKTIYHCPFDTTILDAVKLLDEKNIGSVLVTRDSLHGIFTQRDLVKVLAKGVDLENSVGNYTSFPLVTAKRDVLANEASKIMISKNIKRLGLTENNVLVGIVTARDIVDAYQIDIVT